MDQITLDIKDIKLKLNSKPGVFSAKALDAGTRLLVNQLSSPKDSEVIADLGSGVGIIGFYLAKQNPRAHIHLLDDHIRSVELANSNADLNKLKNVEVFLSDLFTAVKDRTYNQIISNPPQQLGNEFLEELINECHKHLKPGGILWLVVKSNVRPFMERLIESKFGKCLTVANSKEHVILKTFRAG